MMKSLIQILFTLLFIQSSFAQQESKSQITILDLSESFMHKQEIPLSRFVDKITYLPLETNSEALISGYARFEVTEEFVIVKSSGSNRTYKILLFDRNTGKFIREIGKQGRGPGEYSSFGYLPYNPGGKVLYAIGPLGEILVYDLAGKNIDKIKIPEWTEPKAENKIFERVICYPYNLLAGNIFVGYVPNNSGWEKKKLVLFSKEGILKIFPNYLTWNRESWNTFFLPPGGFIKFYRWDNKINFIETLCDTLYQVTNERLAPRYFFDYGEFHISYSKQSELTIPGQLSRYFFISDIDENKNYIFIQLYYEDETYTGFVEKKSNSVTFCKTNIFGVSGLEDDIDGLMDVVPRDFTVDNEMVYIIQPVDLIKWLKENSEKAIKARNKLPWLKNIDEFSNPVIAIAKCKD